MLYTLSAPAHRTSLRSQSYRILDVDGEALCGLVSDGVGEELVLTIEGLPCGCATRSLFLIHNLLLKFPEQANELTKKIQVHALEVLHFNINLILSRVQFLPSNSNLEPEFNLRTAVHGQWQPRSKT